MGQTVSKAKFKAQALAYFRQVEKTKKPLVITDRGRPVLQLMPYIEDPEALRVRGSFPTERNGCFGTSGPGRRLVKRPD